MSNADRSQYAETVTRLSEQTASLIGVDSTIVQQSIEQVFV